MSMSQSSLAETVDACLAAAARGVAWLLDQQTAAGSWRQLEAEVFDAYYKGGWALAVSGQPAAAHRLLTHVQRTFLMAEGDFEPRAAPLHTDIARLYSSSYVILAAQKLDRYDLVAPAARYLLSQQDPDHGGFYSGKTPAGARGRSDSMSTAMSGVALLAVGQTERAALAGDCLLRMVEMQPAVQPAAGRFFTTLDEAGRLQVDFAPEAAVWRVVEAGQTGQRWFAVGLPFAFAVLLHQATGEPRYKQLADEFFAFQSRGLEPWDVPSSGKAGWGCSMLYRTTGETRYRDIALRVARQIMGYQMPAGWFTLGPHPEPAAGELAAFAPFIYDVTAEFVLWLTLIAANAGSYLATFPEREP
jgi:hypothetical protein